MFFSEVLRQSPILDYSPVVVLLDGRFDRCKQSCATHGLSLSFVFVALLTHSRTSQSNTKPSFSI